MGILYGSLQSSYIHHIPGMGQAMKHILRNLTEDIVISKLDVLINRLDCCRCDLCRLDIASYALNRLPCKYVATTQGELLSKIALIDNEFTIRVTTEITKAINVIKEHPRHALNSENAPSDEATDTADATTL